MYRHSEYKSLNAEEEIDRVSKEIKELQWSNTGKMIKMTEIEKLKTENLNLRQKLK